MPQTLPRRRQLTSHRRDDSRQRIERLLHLAEHLSEGDRLLIEEVYSRGLSMSAAARLAGRHRHVLRHKIGRILERMEHPLFAFLAGQGELLDPEVRRIAGLVVFQRQSFRRAARTSGLSLHRVRQHVRTVRTLARM